MSELEPEDAKIITLARSARARNGAAEGAAVRDEMGRTYVGTSVTLPSLRLSALQVAVAAAASGGAETLEAAAVVTGVTAPADTDVVVVRDLGPAAPILVAGLDGVLRATL